MINVCVILVCGVVGARVRSVHLCVCVGAFPGAVRVRVGTIGCVVDSQLMCDSASLFSARLL